MLDMGSFAILAVPLFVFSYILLTNQDSIERALDDKAKAKIYVKGNLSKTTRNALLILSLFLMAFALGRPAMVEHNRGDTVTETAYALVFNPDEREKAKTFIRERDGNIGLFLAADKLYLLAAPTTSKAFLLQRVDTLDDFAFGTEDQTAAPVSIAGVREQTKIIDLTQTDIQPEEVNEEPLVHKNIQELYPYPLTLATVLLFAALFMPRTGGTPLILTLCILGGFYTPAQAFLLDFYDIGKANQLYDEQQYQAAITAYKNISPQSHPQVNYNMANAYYKMRAYKQAAEFYLKFEAKTQEEKFDRWFNLGNTFFMLGDYGKAQHFYKQAQNLKNTKEVEENLKKTTEKIETLSGTGSAVQGQKTETDRKQKYRLPVLPYASAPNTPE